MTPTAELSAIVSELGPDEVKVLVAIARRLALGRGVYGPLDVVGDARDWKRVATAEAFDLAVYLPRSYSTGEVTVGLWRKESTPVGRPLPSKPIGWLARSVRYAVDVTFRELPLTPISGPVRHQKLHRVGVRWGKGGARLLQVQFLRDGYYVNFPYQPDSAGVVARKVLPALEEGQECQIDLAAEGGRTTSHKVKYTHHVDGNCHFSQDGKVYTSVTNKTRTLLDGTVGHVFTLYVRGVDKFSGSLAGVDAFHAGTESRHTLRIVGRWICADVPRGTMNPVAFYSPDSRRTPGLVCCPPPGSPLAGYAIAFECFRHVEFAGPEPFLLMFQGGFGVEARDHTKESSFLGLIYPASPTQGLQSIDIPQI
ncbi:MAG: hypothetical protein ABTD50_24380 [Polyangiaceae bacterium]|jgi:hypothetical protein